MVERVARATLTNVATMGHVWASRQLRSVPLRSGSLRCVPLRYATHAPLRYATLRSTTLHLLRSLRSATLHYACARPPRDRQDRFIVAALHHIKKEDVQFLVSCGISSHLKVTRNAKLW